MFDILNIKYDAPIETWKEQIMILLSEHKIAYDEFMINCMCNSILNKTRKYLIQNGYKPKNTIEYRQNFIKKLSRNGLTLNIKINDLFWLYLDYFTDIEDYTKCFNVEIVISNIEIATKDTLFITVKSNLSDFYENQFKFSEEYAVLSQQLDLIKDMVDNLENPDTIRLMTLNFLDILDYIVERDD